MTALINKQLQGLPLESFTDTYTDPVTGKELRSEVRGLDAVFSGDKIVLLECGLAWFEVLKYRFKDELLSVFISPFTSSDSIYLPYDSLYHLVYQQ